MNKMVMKNSVFSPKKKNLVDSTLETTEPPVAWEYTLQTNSSLTPILILQKQKQKKRQNREINKAGVLTSVEDVGTKGLYLEIVSYIKCEFHCRK